MSDQISTAHVQQFSSNIILLSQQKGSRLRDRVMVKQVTGNAAYFDRIGPTEAQIKTTRHSPSPMVNTPHSRRMVTMLDFNWGDALDPQDAVRMLIDPTSTYAINAAYALGRQIDDFIIAAATGSASSVSSSLPNGNNISSVSLPSSQVVDEDVGTANSNLTIAKLIRARKIFMDNDVDDEDLTLVLNASAVESLLGTTQITSADYNTVKALVKGEIDTFMGFKFVRTNRILGTADGTDTDPKLCLAIAKTGIGLALGIDVKTRVAERSDLSFTQYVYAEMSGGATRVEEEKVVSIECVQS